jgi:hypothetical protein
VLHEPTPCDHGRGFRRHSEQIFAPEIDLNSFIFILKRLPI